MTGQISRAPGANHGLRDDIRDYWSDRAAGFDQDPGHRIAPGAEERAWAALLTRHLGAADGRALLDLACGTGEVSLLCARLGFRVTGLDWSEPMLARARAKSGSAGAGITFMQADAERIITPKASFDVITARHLVWTLVDPAAAFAEWHRVLRPGGQLLIVDGDFVRRGILARILGSGHAAMQSDMARRHAEILSQVYFSTGARAGHVADLIEAAGFTDIRIDHRLGPIIRAQARALGWRKALLRNFEHRYAISARKL